MLTINLKIYYLLCTTTLSQNHHHSSSSDISPRGSLEVTEVTEVTEGTQLDVIRCYPDICRGRGGN